MQELTHFTHGLRTQLAYASIQNSSALVAHDWFFGENTRPLQLLLDIIKKTAAHGWISSPLLRFTHQISNEVARLRKGEDEHSLWFSSLEEANIIFEYLTKPQHGFQNLGKNLIEALDWRAVNDEPRMLLEDQKAPEMDKLSPNVSDLYQKIVTLFAKRAESETDRDLVAKLMQLEGYLAPWLQMCLSIPITRLPGKRIARLTCLFQLFCALHPALLRQLPSGESLVRQLRSSSLFQKVFETEMDSLVGQDQITQSEQKTDQSDPFFIQFLGESMRVVIAELAEPRAALQKARTSFVDALPDSLRAAFDLLIAPESAPVAETPEWVAKSMLGLEPQQWYQTVDSTPMQYLGVMVSAGDNTKLVFRGSRQTSTLYVPLSSALKQDYQKCEEPQRNLDAEGNKMLVRLANDPAYREVFLAHLNGLLATMPETSK